MSAQVLQFRHEQLPAEPTFQQRLVARRIYRARCKDMCTFIVGRAFHDTAKDVDILCDDALPLFVAAMRRELRKSGWL